MHVYYELYFHLFQQTAVASGYFQHLTWKAGLSLCRDARML